MLSPVLLRCFEGAFNMFVLDALIKKSYELDNIQVCTLQALSGAGYKAIKNKSFQNNVIPYIKNEEIKTEKEPLKIFGKIVDLTTYDMIIW